jgi:hypothetical protein
MSGLTQVTSDVISTNTISGLISQGFNTLNVATVGTQTIEFGSSNTLVFQANTSAERMRITANGDIGIGTSNPLFSAGYRCITLNANTGGVYEIRANNIQTTALFNDSNGSRLRSLTNVIIDAANIERMRIANTGRVGIATTTPQTTLDVFGTIQANSVTVTANTVVPDLKAFQVTSPNRHSVRPSLLLDFANTKTLDPRITFTRGSTATFYDGKTVAKAEENLLLQSQDFTTTWGVVETTASSNTTTAPDGTSTADTITETTATSNHRSGQTVTITAAVHVFSVFLKKGGGASAPNWIQLCFTGANSGHVNFDIANGTVGQSGFTGTGTITSVGNGWYRCTLSQPSFSAGATGCTISFVNNTDTATRLPSYAGNTAADVYVWGAQLEQRSAVTAYTATTTAPITNYIPALQTAASGVARFEHNPVTGESLGLEIEEQRTNLAIRSEDFNNVAYQKNDSSTITNTIIAPDGTLTGGKLIENNANAQHLLFQVVSGLSTGATYTYSFYAKAAERTNAQILFAQGSNNALASANLETGTIGSVIINGGNWTGGSAAITSVGNGWYRLSLTATIVGSSALSIRIVLENTTGNSIYTGDGYSGIYIWGTQLEAGAFATSYIKTEGSQVTRSADSASMTGTNFSSWYRADEGTVYTEFSAYATSVADGFGRVWSIDDNGTNNVIGLLKNNGSNSSYYTYVGVGGVAQATLFTGALTANTFNKIGFTYKVNDFAQSTNSVTNTSDTSGTIPIVNQIRIGSVGGIAALNGTIRKIAYYPKRLTNAELQGLTTI